jgi:hypothetical protein
MMKLQLHYHGHEQLILKKTKQIVDYGIRNFALLDDIAALMDDVVVMSKIATKKNSRI